MLRGYRRILIAVAGLVLAAFAQPPAQDGQQPENRAQPKVEQSLGDIASTLRDANKPSDLEQPCQQGDNNRSSDLCAQWKAADAAESAAGAAWLFGALGSIIGALTLAAAIAAALFAKHAAREGQRGADAAEKGLQFVADTNAADLRPYLFIDRVEVKLPKPVEEVTNGDAEPTMFYGGEIDVTVFLKNYGKLPARSIQTRTHVYVTGDLENIDQAVLKKKGIDIPVCAPGQERRVFDGAWIGDQEYIDIVRNNIKLVVIRVRYHYVGIGKKRYSERADYIFTYESVSSGLCYILSDKTRSDRNKLLHFNRRMSENFEASEPRDSDEPPLPLPDR